MTERPHKSRSGRGPGAWRKRLPHERRPGVSGGIWQPAGDAPMRLVTSEEELAEMGMCHGPLTRALLDELAAGWRNET
jgi:hypothetical protein